MSHFTKAKSKIKDLKTLRDALKRKGTNLEIGKSKVRGYSGGKAEADAVIKGKKGYDIGFVLNAEGEYDIVTDQWGLRSYEGIKDPVDLLNSFSQEYTVEEIRQKAFMEGMDVCEHEVDAEGTITLEVSYG